MTQVTGRELGRGLRSIVYEWGDDDVVKIAAPSTPGSWIVEELRLSDSVARLGARVPERRRLVDVGDRAALAAERIAGPSLWDRLIDEPTRADGFGRDLARLQCEIAAVPVSYELPRQRDRVESKIRSAAHQHGADLLDALDLLTDRADGDVLCHGDLHPRNVLLGVDGPVVVDWFDCSRGSMVGEVARTALVLETSQSLRGESVPRDAVTEMVTAYLDAITAAVEIDVDELADWMVLARLSRVAENVGDVEIDDLRIDLARRLAARSQLT